MIIVEYYQKNAIPKREEGIGRLWTYRKPVDRVRSPFHGVQGFKGRFGVESRVHVTSRNSQVGTAFEPLAFWA